MALIGSYKRQLKGLRYWSVSQIMKSEVPLNMSINQQPLGHS